MHEIKVRCLVLSNCIHHGAVRTVCDGIANASLLAFKLVPETAIRAGIITSLGVVAQSSQLRGRAVRAVKIILAPGFGDDAGALGTALVGVTQFASHREIH